ncbi:aquaporin-3-like isoform X2 [Xenia sp. Carnegie-2017]|uniref:aquaporin-3-like isoform X2 n=1 Tax=Xenia sp. Carnegie-2017 TaxID=2897299 RepID=UPI001F046CA4|nr:aquaporin-3-like isoform X2 [Xenia sp. Carnegie-2017]
METSKGEKERQKRVNESKHVVGEIEESSESDLPTFLQKSNFRTPEWLREALAEFMGTFILVVFVIGSSAQAILSYGAAGTALSTHLSGGLALTMALFWAADVSGAHVNPAVTLGFASIQRFPWKKVPIYIASQMLGSIIAAAVVFALYHDFFDKYDGGVRQVVGRNATAGIFTTFPQPFVTNVTGFFNEFFGTTMFVALLSAILDKKNGNKPSPGLAPVAAGFIVMVIGMTFGYHCGYPINPARDLGPRIFIAMAGWGGEAFTAHDHWFWIPPVACSLGGIFGAYLYVLMVEFHRKTEEKYIKNRNSNNQQISMNTIEVA